jgi:hypothetical protein
LIDTAGNFVAEICHIKSAKPAGERFDASMTNEERRAPDNLLLMCHRHHVVTNDVALYPVEAMEAIKTSHEAKFAGGAMQITDEQIDQAIEDFVDSDIADRTLETPFGVPTTCAKLNEVSGWGVTAEEAHPSVAQYGDYVRTLRRVPVDARAVLSVAVERGSAGGYMRAHVECLLVDVALATGRSREEVRELVAVLDKWGIAYSEFGEEQGEVIVVRSHEDLGNLWDEIKAFALQTGMTVRDFAVGLRFDALDEGP